MLEKVANNFNFYASKKHLNPPFMGRVEKYRNVVQFDDQHIAIADRSQIRPGHSYENVKKNTFSYL
jgi:predicted alpha/beta-fold hydrolase